MSDEKAEKSADAGGGGGGGGGSKVVIILAALNTVISIGAAVVLFLAHQKEKNETHLADLQAHGAAGEHGGEHGAPAEGGEHGAPAAGGHGEPAAEGKEAKKNTKFGKIIALDQFTINLSSAGSSLPKFARVNVSLEIGNDDVESEITQKMAQVRNSVIDLFNSKKPSDLSSVEGRNYLKEEIRNAINGFLVTGKIKSVFFTNFAVSS